MTDRPTNESGKFEDLLSSIRSDHFQQTLIDAIPTPVFFKDTQGRYLGCNSAFETFFGKDRSAIIGKSVYDIAPKRLADAYHRQDQALLQSGGTQIYRSKVNTHHGEQRHVVFHKATFPGPDGGVAGLIGAVVDVTDTVQTEQRLAARLRYEKALAACAQALLGREDPEDAQIEAMQHLLVASRASRVYFFENFTDPVDGLCMRQTQEVCAPGVPSEIDNSTLQHLPYADGFEDWIAILSADREIMLRVSEMESPARDHLSDQGILSLLILPVFAENEWYGFIGFDDTLEERVWGEEDVRLLRTAATAFGVYHDRQLSEQRRTRLESQLKESHKMESLGLLAGGIAHDFNNLLMVILGNADLGLSAPEDEELVRECLSEIKSASQKAAQLSNQMRAYSGRGHASKQQANLNSVIGDMTSLLKASLPGAVDLTYDLENALPDIHADPSQLNQVVMNLVLNAAEAIGEQAGLITLRTGSIQADEQLLAQARSDHPLTPGPYVYLKVEDTGGGMDAEALERIFDPFFTTKFIGRGLGLSAVMGIVRGHHGGIIVTSQMGEGTCFQVLLPIESSPPSDPPTRDDQSASSPDGLLDGQGQTILVIDDEQAVLTVASQMLQRLGFQTLLAQNGQQAIQAVQSTPDIRAVLLDLSMPVMSGEKIFTEIQTIQPDMHIFLCSGYSEEETMDRFSKKGICGFLQKPFQLKTLAEKLKPIIQSP